jgi:hypothetical protein
MARASQACELLERCVVTIRFTSTLSTEDENVVAQALLNAAVSILGLLPIAYAMRIETTSARVFEHSCPSSPAPQSDQARSCAGGKGSI